MKKKAKVVPGPSVEQLPKQPARLTPAETSALLLKEPAANWKNTVSAKQSVLTYQLDYAATKGQEDTIKRLIGANPILNFANPMTGRMLIAHAPVNTRVDCTGTSIYGTDFITITEKKAGFLFLDKKAKTYLHVGKEQKVKTYFPERFTATTTVSSNKKEALIEISAPYRLKYVLHLDNSVKLKPYYREVLATVLGCPDQFAAAGVDLEPIIKAGLPVKGELFMLSTKKEWQSMTSFSISHLSLAQGRSHLFDIPAGYKNLRKSGNSSTAASAARKTFPGPQISGSRRPRQMHTAAIRRSAQTSSTVNELIETTLEIPTCFPETYGAKIADLIDEKLLDDVKFLVNAASKRVTGFSGDAGVITMNWLDQVQAEANALATGSAGTGLFTMLHFDGTTDNTGTENLGLLDKLALKSLGSLMAQGNSLTDIGLNPTLQALVISTNSNSAIASQDRFSSLSAADQHALVTAYVFNKIGVINLTYPSTTGTQSLASDLLEFNITDISFDIQINNTAVINTFQFTNTGINLVIDLPDASGTGNFLAWVTWKYWAAVAGVGFACYWSFGAACYLTPILIAVGAFLTLSAGNISIDLSDLSIDAGITMVPNTLNVLEPQVTLMLNATVNTTYTPSTTAGVNNLLGDIATAVLNSTNIVIDALQSQLQTKLNSYLQNDLGITYPPQFGPITLNGLSTPTTLFNTTDFGYAEQTLDAGSFGIIDPYVTQIDSTVQPNALLLRTQFESQFNDPEAALQAVAGNLILWLVTDFTNIARYYAGTVLSQNFINYFIFTLWRNGDFNFKFSGSQTGPLYNQLVTAFPNFSLPPFNATTIMAHLWPSVPPRTLFTPVPASTGGYYATTIFDDVRLCFESQTFVNSPTIEFSFSAQVSTEIGFGALDTSINQLNLLKVSDRVFDIYFEQDLQIINPELQSFTIPNMQPSVNFDYSALTSLQTLLLTALQLSISNRNASVIPRGTGDPTYIQRYPLGTSNAFGPINNGNPLAAVFQLVPFSGNLYVSQGLSGLATGILQGTNDLDIDTMTSVTAQTILLFL